jgi:molybdopterin synthase sulfur carrier subunit
MVPIEVRVPTVLRKHTGGDRTVSGEGATLRELVDDLAGRFPGLRDALVGQDGQLNRFVQTYVNDEDVRFLGGIETPLAEGDQVSILPAVAGG